MTPEQQRIAIAEACGWTDIRPQKIGNDHDLWGTKDGRRNRIHNYLNDLNAMHEAEIHAYKTQPAGWMLRYEEALSEVCSKAQYPHWCDWCATAAQRAEAFLRTLNLYTPTP